MPVCPNCKTEYKDGITTCADCNVALVDSLDEIAEEKIDVYTVGSTTDKNLAIKLAKYLKYSGIGFVYIEADKSSAAFHVNVASELKNEAIKYYDAFCQVEESTEEDSSSTASASEGTAAEETLSEEDGIEIYYRAGDSDSFVTSETPLTEEVSVDEPIDDDIIIEGEDKEFETALSQAEDATAFSSTENKKTYVKKADQYKDLHSSAIIFFLFGIGGLIFVGINVAGIIHFINNMLSMVVMTSMFVAFLILGILSARKAKIVKDEIPQEEEFTATINDWLIQNVDMESFDEPEWRILSNEMLYFKRVNKMKQMITSTLGEIDPSYLDMVIEEYYDKHYTE